MTALADDQRVARGAWAVVAVLLLLGIVANLDRQIIGMMVGPMKADLHITDVQIGLLQGIAFSLLYSASGIPLGYAVDRVSRRLVIFLGVFIWALSSAACGLVPNYSGLLIARFCVGFGEAALLPAAYSILSDAFPKQKLARVMSVFSTGSIVGNATALVIGGLVLVWAAQGNTLPGLPHLTAWQMTFVITGAPGILLAFAIFLVPEPPRRNSTTLFEGAKGELWAFIRKEYRILVAYGAGFGVTTIFIYGIFSWTAVALMRVYHWPPQVVGLRFGLFMVVSGVSGQLINGAVVDRLFKRFGDAHLRYYVFVLPIAALITAFTPFAPNGWIYLCILAPVILMLAFTGVSAAGLQVVTPPHLRGRVSAIYMATMNIIGLALGPVIPAALTEHVFHDPASVRASIAINALFAAPVAALLFYQGMKPVRERLAAMKGDSAISV